MISRTARGDRAVRILVVLLLIGLAVSAAEGQLMEAVDGSLARRVVRSVEGTVLSVGARELLVYGAQAGSLTVRVQDRTTWGGEISGFADLESGMWVRVEGVRSLDGLVAIHIEALPPTSPEPVILVARVEMVDGMTFSASTDPWHGNLVTVVVDGSTVWDGGLSGAVDLVVGMEILVEGTYAETTVLATRVEAVESPWGGAHETCGSVVSVDSSSFLLQVDGAFDLVEVRVGPATEWRGGAVGVEELEVGQAVCVEGERLFGVIEAASVTTRNPLTGQPMLVDGLVLEVASEHFVLEPSDTGIPLTVVVDQATAWIGAVTGLWDLLEGSRVEVDGELLDDGTLRALMVHLPLEEPPMPAFAHGMVLAVDTDGFHLDAVQSLGFPVTVTVGAETVWSDGLTGLHDLRIGQPVYVTGILLPGTDLLEADGVWPGLEDGERGPGVLFESFGQIIEMPQPDHFVLDDGRTYWIDPNTEFGPVLGSAEALELDQYVQVEAIRRQHQTNLAMRVVYQGDAGGGQGFIPLVGVVFSADPTYITLEDGTLVEHTESTVWAGDADQWWSLQRSWLVEIWAFHRVDGALVATEVRADAGGQPGLGDQEWQEGEALVLIEDEADIIDVAARHGAMLAGEVEGVAFLLRWPMELDDQLIAEVAVDPEVRAVEPNYRVRDPESVRRRFVIVDRQYSGDQFWNQSVGRVLNLPEGEISVAGEEVVVAVLDTGVDPDHPVLSGHVIPGGLDLVDDDDEPWEERNLEDDDGDGDVDEAAGHGTFVASLVALVAPEVSILPFRVLDDDGGGTTFGLAVAVAAAIQADVDILNMSLTYGQRSVAIDLLLEMAAEQGIVVVVATGNDGLAWVPFPASDSHALAVTGTDGSGGQLASFANRSDLVVMAAPAEQIHGALDGQRWGSWSGTSLAAPFVSGSVALMLSADPELDPVLVMDALEQGGVPLSDGGWEGRLLDVEATLDLIHREP